MKVGRLIGVANRNARFSTIHGHYQAFRRKGRSLFLPGQTERMA